MFDSILSWFKGKPKKEKHKKKKYRESKISKEDLILYKNLLKEELTIPKDKLVKIDTVREKLYQEVFNIYKEQVKTLKKKEKKKGKSALKEAKSKKKHFKKSLEATQLRLERNKGIETQYAKKLVPIMQEIDYFIKVIGLDDLKTFIKEFFQFLEKNKLENKDFYNDTILLSSRINSLSREQSAGLISEYHYFITEFRIKLTSLNLLTDLLAYLGAQNQRALQKEEQD